MNQPTVGDRIEVTAPDGSARWVVHEVTDLRSVNGREEFGSAYVRPDGAVSDNATYWHRLTSEGEHWRWADRETQP